MVKRYLAEPEADTLAALLDGVVCATARLTRVEVASAIARRSREGAFGADLRDAALRDLGRDFDSVLVVELTSEIGASAEFLLRRFPLRASDAVQLASCLELEQRLGVAVPMIAWDRRLAEAARTAGLATLPAIP